MIGKARLSLFAQFYLIPYTLTNSGPGNPSPAPDITQILLPVLKLGDILKRYKDTHVLSPATRLMPVNRKELVHIKADIFGIGIEIDWPRFQRPTYCKMHFQSPP